MVDKITILEPHFDGAQFGPQTMPFPGTPEFDELTQLASGASDTEDTVEQTDDSKSTGVMLLQGATVFLVMFVVLYVLLSKLAGEDESVEDD